MPAGIEIINTFGSTIIDEKFSNFALIAHGTASVGNFNQGFQQGQAVISFTADSPLVAICSDRFTALWKAERSGNNWNYYVFVDGTYGDIEYFVFDSTVQLTPSDHGVGMQVFNDVGQKVFDASYPPALVVTYIDTVVTMRTADIMYRDPSLSTYKSHLTYGSGRKYAVVHASQFPMIQGHHPIEGQSLAALTRQATAARKTDDGIDIGYMPLYHGLTPCQFDVIPNIWTGSSQDHDVPLKCLVLDVTNI